MKLENTGDNQNRDDDPSDSGVDVIVTSDTRAEYLAGLHKAVPPKSGVSTPRRVETPTSSYTKLSLDELQSNSRWMTKVVVWILVVLCLLTILVSTLYFQG